MSEQAKETPLVGGMEIEAQVNRECVWTYDEHHDKYDTACGHGFQFINGTPEENEAKFCQYCGGRLLMGVVIECNLEFDGGKSNDAE